jgi:hypothetical protein
VAEAGPVTLALLTASQLGLGGICWWLGWSARGLLDERRADAEEAARDDEWDREHLPADDREAP